MDPDTIALIKLTSRTPAEPRWLGVGQCTHCRIGIGWVNDRGYCTGCWDQHVWSRDNRAVCDLIHRGLLPEDVR